MKTTKKYPPVAAGTCHKSRTGVLAIVVRNISGRVKFRHLNDDGMAVITLTRGEFLATYPQVIS
jgi:hypothetical protein